MPPGSDAITIGSVVSVRRQHARSPGLLRHEEEHVRQWRQLGAWRFLRIYLGSYLAWRRRGFGHRAAYRLIPLEVEAERAARRSLAAGPADGGPGAERAARPFLAAGPPHGGPGAERGARRFLAAGPADGGPGDGHTAPLD